MNALTIVSVPVRQIDGLYSLNDLHKAAGGEAKHQPALFMRSEQTRALIEEVHCADLHSATSNSTDLQSFRTVAGRRGGTYVCREIVYAYAMWISPKFHLHVIRAFDGMQVSTSRAISPIEAGELATLIAERFPEGKHRPYAWSRFNNHFRIARYRELPASRFDEARAYIRSLPVKPAALPAPEEGAKDALIATLGDALRFHDRVIALNGIYAALGSMLKDMPGTSELMRREDLIVQAQKQIGGGQ